MNTIDDMRIVANAIKNATVEGENTAYRVGGLFCDIVDYLDGGGGGGLSGLNEPLSSINRSNMGAGAVGNLLIKKNSGWGFTTLSDIAESTKSYFEQHSYSFGSVVQVFPQTISGDKVLVANIKVDGVDHNIYAPAGGGGGGGGGSVVPSDDPIWDELHNAEQEMREKEQELLNLINETNELVQSEKERLDGVIENIDQTVSDRCDALFEDADWVRTHVTEGVIEGWTGWDDKMKEYFQRVGMWKENMTTWSDVKQRYNEIDSSISMLIQDGQYTQSFQSYINQKVQDDVASMELGTLYASKDAEKTIEWLYSGIRNRTSPEMTFAQLVSAAKAGDKSAISEVRTYVGKLANGEYQAVADMEVKVGEVVAGLYEAATPGQSSVSIFSQVKKNSSDISGCVVKSTLDSEMAAVFARQGDSVAGMMAAVNASGSSVYLKADKIYLDGSTFAERLIANTALIGDLIASNAFITNLSANEAFIRNLTAQTIFTNQIQSISGSLKIIANQIYAGANDSAPVFTVDGTNAPVFTLAHDKLTLRFRNNQSGYYAGFFDVTSSGFGIGEYNGTKFKGVSVDYSTSGSFIAFHNAPNQVSIGVDTTCNYLEVSDGIRVNGDSEIDGSLEIMASNSLYTSNITTNGNSDLTITTGGSGSVTIGRLSRLGGHGSHIDFTESSSMSTLTLYATKVFLNCGIGEYAGTWAKSSDEAMKNIIAPVEVAIEDIANARLVDYEYKNNPGTVYTGSIAQDWVNLVPHATPVVDDEGHLGLDYSTISIVAGITAAREIVALKSRVNALEAEVAALKGN